jgi:tetratricopeptide (TPR) repeat protein
LLERLISQFPKNATYVAALATNYNRIGLVDWAVDQPKAAEPALRQSWEIWSELAEQYPNEPIYRDGVADVLGNLGAICYLTGRVELGHEYYHRADALRKDLPAHLNESAEGLASQAGSLTNQAIVAGLRGEYDRAIELLEASIPTHQAALAKWPTNPAALDCYYICLSSISEYHLAAGREAEAASGVARCIQEFPDRLQSYGEGASRLLRCAELSDDQETTAAAYRERAKVLVAQAASCKTCRPDMVGMFAMFLLTCEDVTFREPTRALALAESLVKEVPQRSDAWTILALANYRTDHWQTADNALQKSIELLTDGQPTETHWLLGSMIHWQLGRHAEAQKCFAEFQKNKHLEGSNQGLAAEAAELIDDRPPVTTNQAK